LQVAWTRIAIASVLAGEHNAQIRGNQRQNRKHFHVCCETISTVETWRHPVLSPHFTLE
jgi:hypothetical protein